MSDVRSHLPLFATLSVKASWAFRTSNRESGGSIDPNLKSIVSYSEYVRVTSYLLFIMGQTVPVRKGISVQGGNDTKIHKYQGGQQHD